MSSAISLEKSIRTCKVDTSWANKLESDRFLNANLMLCPPWNGVDTSGRPADWNSYYTKTPGCNSASDRVIVENGLRPQYIEYVNLDATGIRGDLECGNNEIYNDTICHQQAIKNTHNLTGQFGTVTGFSQNIFPNCLSCSSNPSDMAYQSINMRNNQFNGLSGRQFQMNKRSGNY